MIGFHIAESTQSVSLNISLADMLREKPEYFREGFKIASYFGSPAVKWNGGRMILGPYYPDREKAILHGYSKGYAAPEQTYTRNGYKQLVEKPVVDEYHEETRYLFDETAMGKTTMLDPAVISDGNAQGPAYIDVRTDIYGVGAVLYFMLTGYAPVGGNVDFTDIKVSK